MGFKKIVLIFLAIVLIYVAISYSKVEIDTTLHLKEFQNVDMPEEISEVKYQRIFEYSTLRAKILFRMQNGDLIFVYFIRSTANGDILNVDQFGPWKYETYEFIKKESAGKKGLTFPPYF